MDPRAPHHTTPHRRRRAGSRPPARPVATSGALRLACVRKPCSGLNAHIQRLDESFVDAALVAETAEEYENVAQRSAGVVPGDDRAVVETAEPGDGARVSDADLGADGVQHPWRRTALQGE